MSILKGIGPVVDLSDFDFPRFVCGKKEVAFEEKELERVRGGGETFADAFVAVMGDLVGFLAA